MKTGVAVLFLWISLRLCPQEIPLILCFNQAQPKMCHSPKVDDGVDIIEDLFSNIKKKIFKLSSHLNCQSFLPNSNAELGLSISYQLTYIVIKLVLNFYLNRPYTLCGRDI